MLAEKTVLVTGGSRGIGAAIVRRLALSGASVIVHYREGLDESLALQAEIGLDRCRLVHADLALPGGATTLWMSAIRESPRIDCIVCNAAVVQPLTMNDDWSTWDLAWSTTLQVNVKAAADLCRHAVEHFRQTGGGMIISIASRAAFRGDDPHLMHYASSKGALVALTRSIARNYAGENVLAYVVAPGFVRTERQESVIERRGMEAMLGDIPLREMANPESVAEVVAFLASGVARHATGATIDINGASYFH